MKINFYHENGKRSQITIGDKLFDVWSLCLEENETMPEDILNNEIIPEALKGQRSPEATLTSIVEFLMLDDISNKVRFNKRKI